MRFVKTLIWAVLSLLLLILFEVGGGEGRSLSGRDGNRQTEVSSDAGAYSFALSEPLNCGFSCQGGSQGATSHANGRRTVGKVGLSSACIANVHAALQGSRLVAVAREAQASRPRRYNILFCVFLI